MNTKYRLLMTLFFACSALSSPADEAGNTLKRMLLALGIDTAVINARKGYESALVSPLNKRNDALYRIAQASLDELLRNIYTMKEKDHFQNAAAVRLLEDHIITLEGIIQNEAAHVRDDALMLSRGALTELEYRRSLIEYRSKQAFLANMKDDLWLRRLLESFY